MQKTFLFISAQYLPTPGGVERYTNNLARKLISHGHKIIVVTSSLKGLPQQETDSDGIRIIRLPSWAFMKGRLPLLRLSRQFRNLTKELWQIPIDYCVINTYFYPLSMYAAALCHKNKIPAILINHGSAWLMTGNPLLQFAGQVYERISVQICRHYCPRIMGVSAAAKNWMHTFSVSAEGIITNAIDPDSVVRSANTSIDCRNKLGISQNAPVIAFVGRLIPEKVYIR